MQRIENEEVAAAIVSQLLMINSKWERIREAAMSRQNQLQHYLNTAQIEQLESIRSSYLDKYEYTVLPRHNCYNTVSYQHTVPLL